MSLERHQIVVKLTRRAEKLFFVQLSGYGKVEGAAATEGLCRLSLSLILKNHNSRESGTYILCLHISLRNPKYGYSDHPL